MKLLSNYDPLNLNSLSEEQIKTYNGELNVFYNEYKGYLKEKFRFERILSLTLPIDLKIQNSGNIPANDIDIWLHFPDGFLLSGKDDFPNMPKKPKPPHKPKHRYDFGDFKSPMIFPMNFHNSSPSSLPGINPNKPQIRQTNSYEVDFNLRKLKHYQSFSFDQLLVIYASVEKIINFSIEYKIIANNIPEPVTGSISVIAEY